MRGYKFFVVLGMIGVIGATALTGCGSTGVADEFAEGSQATNEYADSEGFDYAYDDYDEAVEEAAEENTEESGSASEGSKAIGSQKLNDEKLIYRCDLSVDTMEYSDSVKAFRSLIKKYDGFVQSENESDDGGYDYYYNANNNDRSHTYTATVRIPSKDYNSFLDEAGSIGDVRSKDSNVENISQSYYDLSAELEVLQTKYERYLDMLSKASTTKDILEIENSITSIETQINQIKTQLNRYDTDVAYSYVDITIREVKEYVDDTDKTTIPGAITDSWRSFTDVAYQIFIALIYLFPYLLIILIVVIVILIIARLLNKNKKNRPVTSINQNSNIVGNKKDESEKR